MTLEAFQTKHKELFDLGVCHIEKGDMFTLITIDRFVPGEPCGTFLCDYDKLRPATADARKMGFVNISTGKYLKSNVINEG